MDSYLTIAAAVLREARRPLSASEILKRAYPSGGMPSHLHGRTQHKTLGARLAEDILERGDASAFYRNAPGRYFLSEFLDDQSIPPEHRQQFIARRRKQQFAQPRPLTFNAADVGGEIGADVIPVRTVLNLLAQGAFHYPKTTKDVNSDDVMIWSFIIVSKGSKILTYRHGQYREEQASFHNHRSIGFFAPVLEGDRTLFDLKDHGIVQKGINALSIAIGLHMCVDFALEGSGLATLECIVRCADVHRTNLLSVIRFDAPDWFEPYIRRLAINDLRWMDIKVARDSTEPLDPWSLAVLSAVSGAFSPRRKSRG